MLKNILLLLIINHMGSVNLESNGQNWHVDQSFFDAIHQSIDQEDFSQAKTTLVQMISQNLLLSESFDYEDYEEIKHRIFKRLTSNYENVPIIFCQLFETISWKDLQKEVTIFKEKIQKQVENLLVSATNNSFYHLPLLEKDKENIRIIITTMASKGLVRLLLERHYLERRGDEVNYIHPMRFIGYIFSDQELKNCMRKIKKSRFKWNEFIIGFSRRMEEEYNIDNLQCYIPEFIEQVHPKYPEHIEMFIKKKAWGDLIADLLH